ncbi:MAG TPA: hypothetical protein VGO04_24595 [Ensifer sp.]|jgi:antitoxin component HigA of HigAB toxin-antitoxin module|uniref:hypothetical protein n=1 Tax=Ensifer sp. TaxID=1872086 RepID=UPI002E15481E|nr:hypothetical protein [Ensifer sp.]
MRISNHDEYNAAVARAHSLSDAPEGSAAAAEHADLIAALRAWDEEHKGENSHGPEPVGGLNTADDFGVSGLPGNLGRLRDT